MALIGPGNVEAVAMEHRKYLFCLCAAQNDHRCLQSSSHICKALVSFNLSCVFLCFQTHSQSTYIFRTLFTAKTLDQHICFSDYLERPFWKKKTQRSRLFHLISTAAWCNEPNYKQWRERNHYFRSDELQSNEQTGGILFFKYHNRDSLVSLWHQHNQKASTSSD